LSAQVLGIRATIFMPENAPLPKVRATEGYGAEVRLAGQTVGDCLALARQFSNATGSVFVHPFDDRDVIIGQGTLALDIVKQCPDVATVVVCTGGGGMLSGIAMAIKQLKVRRRAAALLYITVDLSRFFCSLTHASSECKPSALQPSPRPLPPENPFNSRR
jgi:threonine dehydratase